jgi:hypothetical protein
LSQIVYDQTTLYKNPGIPDIPFSAMAKIRVKRFSTRCTKKNTTKNIKALRIIDQEFNAIIRTECFKDPEIVRHMYKTKYCKHHKPAGHYRTEKPSDEFAAKLLNKKKYGKNSDNNVNNGSLSDIR